MIKRVKVLEANSDHIDISLNQPNILKWSPDNSYCFFFSPSRQHVRCCSTTNTEPKSWYSIRPPTFSNCSNPPFNNFPTMPRTMNWVLRRINGAVVKWEKGATIKIPRRAKIPTNDVRKLVVAERKRPKSPMHVFMVSSPVLPKRGHL